MKRVWIRITAILMVVVLMAGIWGVSGENKTTQYAPEGYVSVLAFGAKGDGVTDDTMAFQWAAQSGNGIFVPAGEFIISDSIKLESRVMIGAGEGESIITFAGTNARKPIIMAGSYSSLRDLTLRFADGLVTGGEQAGDRVAILAGATWSLQRGASLRRITLENVGTGVYSPENNSPYVTEAGANEAGAFSVTFEDVTMRDFSYRGFSFNSDTRTGNVFRNLYFTSRFDADSAVYFTGEESEAVFEGLIVENVRAARPVYMHGMRATKFGTIAFYNTETTVAQNAVLTMSNTNGLIDSLIVRNCKASGSLIRLDSGEYEYGTGSGASPTSWLKVGTMVLNTVTESSIQDTSFSFVSRKEGASGKYVLEIDRYLYGSQNGDAPAYRELPRSGDGLTVTVKEAMAQ